MCRPSPVLLGQVDWVEPAHPIVIGPAALTAPKGLEPERSVVLAPGSFYNDLDRNYNMKDGNPFEAHPHA